MLSVTIWAPKPVLSTDAFQQLGRGVTAYIRRLTPAEIRAAHPDLESRLSQRTMYFLYSANGSVLAMRRTRDGVVDQAHAEALYLENLH